MTGSKGTGQAPPPTDTPESLAVAAAKKTGKPVDVAAMRTESSDVVAQPDGRLLSTTYVQPKRVRRAGAWVDIDPTLQVRSDGSVAPKAATADVVFSGGGAGHPLVRMASAGKQLSLSWPQALPKPVVNGSTAEYRSILPDVDLKLTATRTGFTQVFVVHSAAAAKNPQLDALRLGMKGDGLTVKEAADGSLSAVDKAAGGTVFQAPTPVMWDSSTPVAAPAAAKTASARTAVAAAAAADAPAAGADKDASAEPQPGAKVAKVAVDFPSAQDRLVLTPNQAMLDDPATVYPVMIDPSWDTPARAGWAGVSKYYPNQAYWHYTYTSSSVYDFGVGYCGDTSRCAPLDVKRVFFQVPTSQFVGKQILKATFGVWESHSYSCTKKPVELWNTKYFDSKLTWNAQNTFGSNGFWSRNLQTITDAKGWGGSGSTCSAGGWLEFGGDNSSAVRTLVQDGANWGWPTASFGLKATDEGDTNAWKKFSDGAYLQVYYNLPPRQPAMSDLTMSPGSVCSATTVKVNTMPQLTARLTDPDGEAIGAQFAIGWDDGTGWKRRWWNTGDEATQPASNTFKASGSLFSLTPPAGTPVNRYLTWEVRAWDGAQWGPWSSDGDPSACYVNVDTSTPDGPVVTSPSYPISKDAGASLPWTDGVGRYGTFTLDSVATDVVTYQWGLDTQASAAHQIATSGGAARTINVLPETPGLHTLTVKSINAAGTASQPETYYFNVRNGLGQRAGWALDETSGTTFAGNGRTVDATLAAGTSVNATGHTGAALSFDGTANGYADTETSVVDTAKSFTVSVWANIADIAVTRTAVSQAGVNTAFFDLGERSGKWSFTTFSQDLANGFSWQGVNSTAAVVPGRWTHLTGVYDSAGQKVSLYVDGALAGESAAPASFSAAGPLEFGRLRYMGKNVDPWKGSLDEVKLWDRALTAADIVKVAADQAFTTGTPARAVWHLDEAAGATTVAGTSESETLTASGGVQVGSTGIAAQAAHFDGASGYAKTSRPQVDGTRSFAVAAWVRTPKPADTDTKTRVVAGQTGQHNNEFALYFSGATKKWVFGRYKEDSTADTLTQAMQPDCAAGTTVNGVPCLTVTDNQWTHVLGVSDATAKKLRLYVNGFLVGETDYVQTTPWAAPGPVQVGAGSHEGSTIDFFNGDIDDVRVYDRVVTAPEAADMVNQRPQLAGRWKLDTSSGDPKSSPDEGPAHSAAVLEKNGAAILANGGPLPVQGTLQLDGVAGAAQSTGVPLHTDQSFTLAGWANTAGVPTRDMAVLSQTGATGGAVTLRWHYLKDDPTTGEHLGEWQVSVANTDSTGAARTTVAHSPAASVLEMWTHLAVVYDALSGRLTLYVNGSVENQSCDGQDASCTVRTSWAPAVRPFDATGGLQFGRTKNAGAWGEFFSGELDDVWAYQGVLSPIQIVQLSNCNNIVDTATGP
ncbi:LamG-like jellyroll fold domain-containing protein [Kitasatospora sp. NPDC093679]|uniref:LamG-like jellyroll fold domain-containing protein n=1 Tax=Kitasatospora sp. NPDC093679 TaxID=3154983 RepID=UPI00341EE5A2